VRIKSRSRIRGSRIDHSGRMTANDNRLTGSYYLASNPKRLRSSRRISTESRLGNRNPDSRQQSRIGTGKWDEQVLRIGEMLTLVTCSQKSRLGFGNMGLRSAVLRWNNFTMRRWDEGRIHGRRDRPTVRFAWLGRRRARSTGSRDCPPSARSGRVARE
jgi:hypothetical protein